ncbi:MAG: putative nucleic acid-binding Zn ribbon protein [Alpinimonas sp.]
MTNSEGDDQAHVDQSNDEEMFHVKQTADVNESSSMYERLKSRATGLPFKSRRKGGPRQRRDMDAPGEAPFTPGRDPRGLGSVLDNLTVDLGWSGTLAKSQLLVSWVDVVGADIAARTNPIAIEDNTLTVACESTAWATQLRLMSSEILTKILQRFPESDVTSVRFQGPNAPSWKRGPRSIPGRGPRDTYG